MKEFIKQIAFFFVLIILISSVFMMFKMDDLPVDEGATPAGQGQPAQ